MITRPSSASFSATLFTRSIQALASWSSRRRPSIVAVARLTVSAISVDPELAPSAQRPMIASTSTSSPVVHTGKLFEEAGTLGSWGPASGFGVMGNLYSSYGALTDVCQPRLEPGQILIVRGLGTRFTERRSHARVSSYTPREAH